jgi:hypothetical protein
MVINTKFEKYSIGITATTYALKMSGPIRKTLSPMPLPMLQYNNNRRGTIHHYYIKRYDGMNKGHKWRWLSLRLK